MSVYQGARYLGQALDSLRRQTLSDIEILVVDDGSTDGSATILAEQAATDCRLRIIRHEGNIGLTRSLNEALALARAPLVARMDADDVALPERLQAQVDALQEHPEMGVVGSAFFHQDDSTGCVRLVCHPCTDTEIRWQLLFVNAFCHSTVMFRRSALVRAGGAYDETLECAQDYELWSRLATVSRVANLATPLVVLRSHPGSVSVRRRTLQDAVADRVSDRQIDRLGEWNDLETDRRRRIRWSFTWNGSHPKVITPEFLEDYRRVLALAAVFQRQAGIDRCRLHQRLAFQNRNLLAAIGWDMLVSQPARALLCDMLRLTPGIVCGDMARRMVSRCRRERRKPAAPEASIEHQNEAHA